METPRPGDQPPPVHNDGPSMHDLVCKDLQRWTQTRAVRGVIADMAVRKQVGLDRYGTILQAHNGRDAPRDLYEELQDALVYFRQWIEELPDSQLRADVSQRYRELLSITATVWRLRHG